MLARSLLVSTATARAVDRFAVARLPGLGRVAEDHRHVHRPGLGQVAVVLVAFEDGHRLAGRDQPLDHPQADRAEPDHDHVVVHAVHLLAPERLLDAPADQQVGQQGVGDRDQGEADDHEQHAEDPQPGRLAGEVEVAVAGRGQGRRW